MVGLMMEATRISETLVNLYETTRGYDPEDSHLLFQLPLNIYTAPKPLAIMIGLIRYLGQRIFHSFKWTVTCDEQKY